VVLDAADHELVQRDLAEESSCGTALTRNKLEILAKLGDASAPIGGPRIRLAYGLTPQRILGEDRVDGVEFTATGTDETRVLDAGLVLTSIGYRGKLSRSPLDDDAQVVPNMGAA
jgi:ferredoxin--NADP+ reductase